MKKKTLIISLVAVAVAMGIGFSILSNHLKIQGTATTDSAFNVEITGIKKAENLGIDIYNTIGAAAGRQPGVATEISEPTFTSTTANFNVRLGVDSSITYLVTVENKGTMDAKFDDVVINKSDDSSIVVDTPVDLTNKYLMPGQKMYYVVTLSYPFSDDMNDKNSNISIEFDAKQVTDYNNLDPVSPHILATGTFINFVQTNSLLISILNWGSFGYDEFGSAYKVYESVDNGEFVELNKNSSGDNSFVSGLGANVAGIPAFTYYVGTSLQDGTMHTIKLKVAQVGMAVYNSNVITVHYQKIN